MYLPISDIFEMSKNPDMRNSIIIGLLLLTAGLFGVATLNNIISHAMAQGYYDDNYYDDASYSKYPTDDKKYDVEQVILKDSL